MTTPDKDKRGFWRALGTGLAFLFIGTLGLAIGLAGFAVSFDTLMDIAKPVHPGDIPSTAIPWAALLPGAIDGGIMFLSIMRIVQAIRGKRSLVIEILEYTFIGATIVLNATEGETLRDRAVHAAFPAIYVVVVAVGAMVLLGKFETIREKIASDRISFARWLLAFVDTFSLWRNMKIGNTRSFRVALLMERHKIAQYEQWRRDGGAWWWLPLRRTGVSRAARKALRLELAEIAIEASRVPAGDVPTDPAPVPDASLPPSRPVPDPRPAPVPAVPAPVSPPRPRAATRDVPAPKPRTGTLDLAAWPTEDQNDQIMAALRAFLDPAVESPYPSQAAIADEFGSSTTTVSRLKQRVEQELKLARVNGSEPTHG